MKNKSVPVILLAFANGEKGAHLKFLSEERKGIIRSLEKLSKRGICDHKVLWECTFEEILKTFRDQELRDRIAIFHYSGHAGSYRLKLAAPFEGKHQDMYADGFADFLKEQKGLKMVFLNACATLEIGKQIHEKGIPFVVTTKSRVYDKVAMEMGVQFYSSLGAGYNFGRAYRESKAYISAKGYEVEGGLRGFQLSGEATSYVWENIYNLEDPSILDWSLPKASNDYLFGLPELPEKIGYPGNPFPGGKPYGAEFSKVYLGRNRSIRELYDAVMDPYDWSIISLKGSTGVGKTSLLKSGLIPRLEKVRTVYYEDLPTTFFEIELAKSDKEEGQNSPEEPGAVYILDDLFEMDLSLLKRLIQLQETNTAITLVISSVQGFPRRCIHWIEKNRPGLSYKEITLNPLGYGEIREIIHSFSPVGSLSMYELALENRFSDRIAGKLTEQENSIWGNASLLQCMLSNLWLHESREFSWDAFMRQIDKGLWKNYIHGKLMNSVSEGMTYEWLLNLLYQFVEAKSRNSLVDTPFLKKRFPQKAEQISPSLFTLLKKQILISDTWDPEENEGSFRLSHYLLEFPIVQLFQESRNPAQKAYKLLLAYPKGRLPIKPDQWKLIQDNLHSVPQLEGEVANWLNAEGIRLKTLRQKKWIWLVLRVVLLVAILAFGNAIDNSYFLLYLGLIILLYRGPSWT